MKAANLLRALILLLVASGVGAEPVKDPATTPNSSGVSATSAADSAGPERRSQPKRSESMPPPRSNEGEVGNRRSPWRAPVILPSEKATRMEPENAPSSGGIVPEWAAETFRRYFPGIAGSIILLLGFIVFQSFRQTVQKKDRERIYRGIIERDWESPNALRAALEQISDLREQAQEWTPEQLRTYRENDVMINSYDYDRLWDTWKRYEVRGFEPEIHVLAKSGWTETEINELMRFYVREMKARWEILRIRRIADNRG